MCCCARVFTEAITRHSLHSASQSSAPVCPSEHPRQPRPQLPDYEAAVQRVNERRRQRTPAVQHSHVRSVDSTQAQPEWRPCNQARTNSLHRAVDERLKIVNNVTFLFRFHTGELLVWLSVWRWVQMICIWSNWCHCHPIISCSSKMRNGLPFWCWLIQVVLEKRLLNRCSSSSFV